MASPLPDIQMLTDCGPRMRAPYAASPLAVPVPKKKQVKVRKTGPKAS